MTRFREWWIVGLAVTALAVLLAWDGTLRRADATFYDLVQHVDGRDPDPAILIVAIDEDSLRQAGPWLWPRARHAALIDRLHAAGARLVGYDVLFLEPMPGDDAMDRAMRQGMPVFLPLLVERPGLNGADHALHLPVLAKAAAAVGHVGVSSDLDGPVRHGWLWDGGSSRGVPHMILRMAERLGIPPPATGEAPVLIPFTGPSGHYPSVSAAAVLAGQVPPELLRGRVVLVGATAPGFGDQHPVAVGRGTMAGVELQANLLDGLLHHRLIREGGAMAALVLAVPAIWLLILALRFLTPRRSLMVLAALLVLLFVGSAAALLILRLWAPPATAVAMLLLLYPLWSWRRLAAAHRYMTEELERLEVEPDLLPLRRAEALSLDPVTRQSALLQDAIARLRDLRAFIAAVLDQLPDIVLVVDREGRVLSVDGGAPLPGLAPASGQELTALLADLRPAPGHPAPEGLASQSTVLLTPDDQALSYSLAPWSDGSGATAGWLARISDITPLRAVEAQREEMLRFLTHDMRSPQASILACLSTASLGQVDPGLAARIEAYARRTLDLADGFVRLARAEAGPRTLEPVSLADILIDAADDLWPQASARGVTIRTEGEGQEIWALGDRGLLTRALINLLANAVRYSPDGGEVCIVLTTTTATALFTVEDDGPGVALERVPTLFRRFASEQDGQGIGLGLSFVDAVARGHGGRVWYEGAPGGGARFCLVIALGEAGEVAGSTASLPED